jgi:Transmembrane secretion effector
VHNYEGSDPIGGFARSQLLAPLRVRDFRLLWSGMTVSLLGDGVFVVALAWQTYELSDLPTALSLVMLCSTVPQLALLLFGGVVSDRLSRTRVMFAADVVRGLAIGTAAWLSVTGELTVGLLAATAAVYGAGTAFFGPAFDALVPDIVPAWLLPRANSLDQLVKPLALRMIGPALGGWLIGTFGVGWALGFNALSFALSAPVVLWIRPPRAGGAAPTSVLDDLRAGLVYVRRNVWLWGTFGAAAVAYLCFMGPAEVLLPFLVKEDMGGSAVQLSLVFTMGGVGSVLAAVLMGSLRLPRRSMTFIYAVWTLSTLMVAGYGFARLPWQLMVVSFAFNALETAGTIVWITTKQRLIPGHLLGRVSSLDWFISIGLLPVSFALTGHAAAAFGERAVLVGAGAVGAVVTLAALFLPGMRDPERADDRRAATAAPRDAQPVA